ncbi:Na+/H+ antiporter subunit D, partial [Streptomyces sp. SID6013]|nr:Na+/H+ antiporter subunit D [Streptomyces sp. SID6013]
ALVAGSAATSLLTLYVMAKVWNLAFWRDAPPGTEEEGVVLESAEDDEPGDDEDDGEEGRASGPGRGTGPGRDAGA